MKPPLVVQTTDRLEELKKLQQLANEEDHGHHENDYDQGAFDAQAGLRKRKRASDVIRARL